MPVSVLESVYRCVLKSRVRNYRGKLIINWCKDDGLRAHSLEIMVRSKSEALKFPDTMGSAVEVSMVAKPQR